MSDITQKIKNIFTRILPVSNENRLEITLLVTTDLHGQIYPYDYISGQKKEWGLAKIATRVEQYRKKNEHVILLDNGDFLQGSPLNYYYNYIDKKSPYPLAEVMNRMHFTASSVGNHDIEQGPKVYKRIMKLLQFPWLSANANTKSGKSFFQPFTIREVEGIRVAILGLTTPAIPLWINSRNYQGIRWQNMSDAAAGWVKYFKNNKKADILIGLFHAGIHPKAGRPEWPSGIPEENPSLQIAKKYPRYDVIITGHEHDVYNSHPRRNKGPVDEPLVIMPGSFGEQLGVVSLIFHHENSRWVLKEKYAKIESMAGVKPSPEILKLYAPYHDQIMEYISSRIGEATADIPAEGGRLRDNAFVDLIHQAQFKATTAAISLATIFTPGYTVKRGPVSIKDVYGLYPYDNSLYVMLLTGRQIKEHLEYSAGYFNRIDPDNPDGTPLINPDFKGFNYDMAKGIRYEIDVTKPQGRRIVNLRNSETGEKFSLEKKYKVAVNSYRAIQLQKKYGGRILWKSNKEMRDILIDYIRKQKKIGNEFTPNWRLVPREVISQIAAG